MEIVSHLCPRILSGKGRRNNLISPSILWKEYSNRWFLEPKYQGKGHRDLWSECSYGDVIPCFSTLALINPKRFFHLERRIIRPFPRHRDRRVNKEKQVSEWIISCCLFRFSSIWLTFSVVFLFLPRRSSDLSARFCAFASFFPLFLLLGSSRTATCMQMIRCHVVSESRPFSTTGSPVSFILHDLILT